MSIWNSTVAMITWRSLFGRKRALLVLPMPVILIAMTFAGHLASPDPRDWGKAVLDGLGIGVVVPVFALIIGSSVIGSEIEDGTIVHTLSKPLSRLEIVVSKIGVAAIATALVSGLTMFICGTIASSVADGIGLGIGAAVASVCYCALFGALSVVSRRPVLIGVLYILIWENLLTNVLMSTRSLSIEQYAVTIASKISPAVYLDPTVSFPVAVVMSAVFIAGGVALAAYSLRSLTLRGETS